MPDGGLHITANNAGDWLKFERWWEKYGNQRGRSNNLNKNIPPVSSELWWHFRAGVKVKWKIQCLRVSSLRRKRRRSKFCVPSQLLLGTFVKIEAHLTIDKDVDQNESDSISIEGFK